MSLNRNAAIVRICQEAFERPPADRDRYVTEACAGDASLRQEIDALLAHDGSADHFLTVPAVDVEARQIADAGAIERQALVGQTLSHYRIVERVAEGGMGIVYKAIDTRLGRPVALKLIGSSGAVRESDSQRRFVREARAASLLNHPNIVSIHDVDEQDGVSFLVMELVDGQPLGELTPDGGLPIDRVLDYALQIAAALETAHAAGIVHRDIKPANIMVSGSGRVKVLDFGLAKHVDGVRRPYDSKGAAANVTETGVLVGTVAYMSPEQAQGLPVDARADVFALGAVLYEMLAGARAFHGATPLATLSEIVSAMPPPLTARRRELPLELVQLVEACLEKRAESRPTAHKVVEALEAIRDRRAHEPALARSRRARRVVAALVALAALASIPIARSWWKASARVRWAHSVALPEIQRLADVDDNDGAFRLLQEALTVLPDDPSLKLLLPNISLPVTITTDPPGAEVAFRGYRAEKAAWYQAGRSPLSTRVPVGLLRYKVSKPGFRTLEVSRTVPQFHFRLDPPASVPDGMVRASGGRFQWQALSASLDDYWIDKYEVTNRQFKAFVDAGGYRTRHFWSTAIEDQNHHMVSWADAMATFRDATGRPGPSTWEFGTYPDGKADFPVSGVSWYEAQAYAAFAGKSLPTIYHWYNAAAPSVYDDMVVASNSDSTGPAEVGRFEGVGAYGTYDMAGNVKEWIESDRAGDRFILGGAWDEPSYMFTADETSPPFERHANYGFRCVKYINPPAPSLLASIDSVVRDRSGERPVDNATFEAFLRLYRYDRTPLAVALEPLEETAAWTKETVSFNAAYGKERMRALLFLPKNAAPPYQLVVYSPTADAFMLRSTRDLRLHWIDFIVRSGRALLLPIYLGAFERGPTPTTGPTARGDMPNGRRDTIVAWSKDIGRSLDYAETRGDIDPRRVAFYSVSKAEGAVLAGVEPRFAAVILQSTGLSSVGQPAPPEIDNLNFASRVRVPTLLLNGRRDINNPVEQSQRLLFRLLGTPNADKRHVVFDSGHVVPLQPAVREILDWLDRYLGPVTIH
jgi:eukaryotic-like serine/threonine-protein kinase